MKSVISLTAALMLSIVCAGVSRGQKPTPESIFSSFRRSIGNINLKLRSSDKQDRQYLSQIDQSVSFLQEKVAAGEFKPVPDQYLNSLQLDADLLAEFAAEPKPSSEDKRQALTGGLETVASDLAIKVSHLKSPRKGPALVEVTVRARMNGVDVNDYEIWYVPKGWANKETVFKRFDKLTNQYSPPRMFLAPGNYFMWLKKAPGKTERQPVTLGGDGNSKREIELPIS